MLRLFPFAAVIVATALAQPAPKPAPPTQPSAALLAHLQRGVNLSHLWWKPSELKDARGADAVTTDDVALFKSAGITHVRIPVDPALVAEGKDRLNPAAMATLTEAVRRLHAAGIATVLDAHTTGTAGAVDKNPDAWEPKLTAFWTLFAPAWKQTSPDLLAVELLNEPNGLKDDKEWPAAQERLRAAVRKALPKHAIILTGDDWGSIDGLMKLTPSSDANTLYSFHFYEPHTFTHQQATWGSPMWKEIKNLRYPFDQPNADAAAAAAADPKAASSIRWYAKDKWDGAKVHGRFDKVKAWADAHHATLYLGEFGAYRQGCDEVSRSAWLKDVRTAAEKNGIGWCVWDYAGGFAVTDKPDSKNTRTLNEPSARALGLTLPAPRKR
jgi:aryl-phospho-beta-D-glucosidase BglC (GH1 family)